MKRTIIWHYWKMLGGCAKVVFNAFVNDKTTTTTTVYFNEVVFPSVLGLTFPQHRLPTTFSSILTCPKHLPYKVPSFSYLLSTLLSISSWAYLSLHHHLPSTCSVSILFIQHNSSLLSTWPNHPKPPQPVSSHHFTNVINCQHAPHTLITFSFT